MTEKAGRPTAPGAGRHARHSAPLPGDPPALPALLDERLRFETLLVDLSATFVRVPADQIDTQIEHALGRMVAFLGVERGTLGEYLEDRRQFLVTHSHE